MEYYYYLVSVGVMALVVLTIIIVKEIKKRERRDLVIAYLPLNYGKYISIIVSYFLIAFLNINSYIKHMKKLYKGLSPKYVDSINKLVDPNYLDLIANRLLDVGEDTLAFDVFSLARKNSSFFTGLVLVVIGIYYLYIWLSRDEVWEEGIYYDGSILLWEKIKNHKWERVTKVKNGEIFIKYYKLSLGVNRSKIGKAVSGEDTYILSLNVNNEDKDKLDEFLCEKIVQS